MVDPETSQHLQTFTSDEQVPATVRAALVASITTWTKAVDLHHHLGQQLQANHTSTKLATDSAAATLLDQLNSQRKTAPNLASIASDLVQLCTTGEHLTMHREIAARAAHEAARTVARPLTSWPDAWTWCAAQRVKAGRNNSAPDHVAWLWSITKQQLWLPYPTADLGGVVADLKPQRQPHMGPLATTTSELLKIHRINPNQVTGDQQHQLRQVLAEHHADWFALVCAATGHIEQRQRRWYTTATLDQLPQLEQQLAPAREPQPAA